MNTVIFAGDLRKYWERERNKRKILAFMAAAFLLSTGATEAGAKGMSVIPQDENGRSVSSDNSVIIQGKKAILSNDTVSLGTREVTNDSMKDGFVVWDKVYGGQSKEQKSRNCMNNKISISSKRNLVIDSIYGGSAEGSANSGDATGNQVNVHHDGKVYVGDVRGGYSEVQGAYDNEICFSGKGEFQITSESRVIGGYGYDEDSSHVVVAGNRVTFSDEVNVSGAYFDVIGGEGGYWAGVEDNTVTFDSSGNIEVMLATGGRSHGLVQNNHVEMKKGENTIEYIRSGWSEQMDTVGNTVEITGGHLKVKEIIGGVAEQGSAIGNIISLGNATIESADKYYPLTITAGYAYGRYHGKAEDNKIILKSSLDLSGASLEGWGNLSSVELSSHKGNELILESTGNTVKGIKNFDDITFMKLDPREAAITIADGGIIDLDETVQSAPATLMSISDESMDSETWNVNLHLPSLDRMAEGVKMGEAAILIDASKASSVKGLDALAASFESSTQTLSYKEGEIRVTGTAGTDVTENKLTYGLKTIDEITYGHLDWKENDTVITLDESRNFDLSDTKVKLGNLEFKAGSLKGIDKKGAHQMTLLDTAGNTTLKEENIEGNKESSWTLGNALAGKGSASLEENGNLIYTIHASEDSIKATEETHHILMGREGDMGLLSAGKDRIMNVFSSMKSEEGEPMIFASVGYGYDRYDTGSHIKSHNWTGLAGVGQEKTIRKGTLSYGLFYERGDGSYKTYNADFTGKGDNDYNGGGLLLRYMMDNRTYVEGSLRMGHMDSHGDNMLRDAEGKPLSYDSDSNYWGTHIGIGHVFDLTDEKEALPAGVERAAKDIDVYGKYFHTHLGGDTVTVNGIAYNLDAIDSDLLRIGTRFNYRQGRNTFYAGIAWDYEMSGKGTGTVSASGMSAPIRSTDTKGGSFMAEAGWKLERAHDNPWTMDVNLAAYGGQHRGIYGNVSVGYRF